MYFVSAWQHTQASSIACSGPPCSNGWLRTCARRSSNPFALVLSSFLDKFLKATTICGSCITDRSGGSIKYDKVLLDEAESKVGKPNPVAARLLDACDLNCRCFMMADDWICDSRVVTITISLVANLHYYLRDNVKALRDSGSVDSDTAK